MSVWDYTAVFVILFLLYYDKRAWGLIKMIFKTSMHYIETGEFEWKD